MTASNAYANGFVSRLVSSDEESTIKPSEPGGIVNKRDFGNNVARVEEHDQDCQSGKSKCIIEGL